MNREAERKRLTTDKKKIFARECPTLMSITKDELRKLYNEIFDRLQEYEVAEETGKIIVPPVKVGDTVWDNDFGRPCSYIVTGFDIGKTLDDEENHKELFMYYENSNGSVQCNCPISQIGKTVFTSREDALKALEGSGEK